MVRHQALLSRKKSGILSSCNGHAASLGSALASVDQWAGVGFLFLRILQVYSIITQYAADHHRGILRHVDL